MITKALVVGLGSIGERHLRILRARLPAAKILVLRSNSCEGIKFCTTSIDEALSFAPQVAVIASPAPFHMDTAAALIRNNCAVLVEKPIAARSDGVAEILNEARQRDLPMAVGYNLRFLDTLNYFRDQVRSGLIGRIWSVRANVGQYLPDWRPGRDWRETVSARPELGGGVMRELSHEIDYLRWIFGDVDWVRAWTGYDGLNLAVEDTAHLVLGFQRGVGGANVPPPTGVLSMDFARRDGVRNCAAIGSDGTLIADFLRADVRLCKGSRTEEVLFRGAQIHPDTTYLAQLDAFLASVQARKEPPVPAEDGLAVLHIIEAAEQSQRNTGAAVKVKL